MSKIFKEITVKDIHWVAAGLVAIGLWILLWTLPCQISGGADWPARLVLILAATPGTYWGFSGFVSWVSAGHRQYRALKKRRKVIRDLTRARKDILYFFLLGPSKTVTMGFNSVLRYLQDIGVIEWGSLGNEQYGQLPDFRITDDYWDLLHEEGWVLLYEGTEQPSNDPPDRATK